jgi:hypothetical protein
MQQADMLMIRLLGKSTGCVPFLMNKAGIVAARITINGADTDADAENLR